VLVEKLEKAELGTGGGEQPKLPRSKSVCNGRQKESPSTNAVESKDKPKMSFGSGGYASGDQ